MNNLAQISTPVGLVKVYWVPTERSVLFEHNKQWTRKADGNIYETLSSVVYPNDSTHSLMIDDVTVFEGLPSVQSFRGGSAADASLMTSLPSCDWSDYGIDLMAFRATLYTRSVIPPPYDGVEAPSTPPSSDRSSSH